MINVLFVCHGNIDVVSVDKLCSSTINHDTV